MATLQSYSALLPPAISPSRSHRRASVVALSSPHSSSTFPSNFNPISSRLLKFPPIGLRCNSSGNSGGNDFETVLDAFFLGKAVGEALTERVESSVGEFLSVIGRLQAEQQKQMSEFQEEVLKKARQAKEQASREALEARGLISKSTPLGESAVESVADTTSSVTNSVVAGASSIMQGSKPNPTDEDSFFRLFDKD